MKDKPVILVVDDQPQNIELLQAYLDPQGYEIVNAANGEEALGKLSGNQIDLILLDVMMPGMDGFEVTRRIRQDATHRLLPIILVTALRATEDRVKGIESGCDDFISKPLDKTELLARVRSLLRVKASNDLMSNYLKELEVAKISADEAREYAESIINTVREPLISLDQDLRVVTVSRSFYEVFKVNHKETVGQLIYDLGNKQWDIPKLRELLETILPQKASFDNYEVEHDFATIGKRIMLLNARQIQRGSGKERIILLAIEDITEQANSRRVTLELNEYLKNQAGELTALNHELDAFGHTVSHELRNPLHTILLCAEYLCKVHLPAADEQLAEATHHIQASAQHMSEVINDLLSLSKISRQNILRSMVNLSDMVEGFIRDLKTADPHRSVAVVIQSNIIADGDAGLLQILFLNLVRNAWKYTSKTSGAQIEVGMRDVNGTPAFFVQDNGAGFDMAKAEKLFQPFQRLHSDQDFKGTGIGLATAKRIVDKHGGSIWAEGEINKGATIYFRLG